MLTWLVATILLSPPAEFPATVVRVKDGDRIVVLKDRKQITVRLEGIDCPESGQAYGGKAKDAVSRLALGKTVTVQPTGKDRYDRTLASIVRKRPASSGKHARRAQEWPSSEGTSDGLFQ